MFGGATLGGMLGGGIGILGGGVGAIPGSLLGAFLGGPLGDRLMDYVYRLSYFKNAGMTDESLDSIMKSDVINNFKGLFGIGGQKNRKDALIGGGSDNIIGKVFSRIAPFITPGGVFMKTNNAGPTRVNPDYTGNMTNEQFLATVKEDYPNLPGGVGNVGGMTEKKIVNNIFSDKGLNPVADKIITVTTPAARMATTLMNPVTNAIGQMGLINK